MYEDILVPFDGSEGATDLLDHVGELARWADATVHVLFVADTMRDSVTMVEADVVDTLVQRGESILADAAETIGGFGIDVETDVVQGNPVTTIVDYADEYGHDLIVMPTHGREGISRYLLGSVTEKVIRLSSRPVLTARMAADERFRFPYETILVPTDGSRTAEAAGEYALSLATALDCSVHALSVVDESPLAAALGGDTTENDEAGPEEALEAFLSEARDRDLTDVTGQVERGAPAEAILEYVDAHTVDAVVMGTTGRRGTERILLGSVAEKTIRSAPVPVFTIRDGRDPSGE